MAGDKNTLERQANQQQPNDNPAHTQQAEQAQYGQSPAL